MDDGSHRPSGTPVFAVRIMPPAVPQVYDLCKAGADLAGFVDCASCRYACVTSRGESIVHVRSTREDFPWAAPWARVTTALAHAVAVLARELSWQGTPAITD